jgi:hypothetical protein
MLVTGAGVTLDANPVVRQILIPNVPMANKAKKLEALCSWRKEALDKFAGACRRATVDDAEFIRYESRCGEEEGYGHCH